MVLTTSRRVRRRIKVALAASVVLLVLLTAYLTVTLRYELTHGSSGWAPDEYSVVTAGGVTEHRHLAWSGRTIEFAMSIANRGPLTVRLEEVIHDGGSNYTLEQVRMYYDGRGGQGSPFDAVPFRPIDLPPDDEVQVYLTLRLATVPNMTCAGFWLYSQRVRFKVLGIPREQLVPIGDVISVLTPKANGQPCAAETWKTPTPGV
ncbi:hypothetical protein ACFOW4_24635 [Micromonospora sp. GCM10011542]|uniref:hypothetical protein n=1 Tax=Micromonospora sp. GCM10011542 TaxID=3317337 RepID=UPI003614483A